jgi:hypothetical protein
VGARAARQVFLVGLALALWSALGRAGWLELLACYVVGLGSSDVAAVRGLVPSLPARSWVVLGLLLALPGLRFAYNARSRFLEDAGLVGVMERLGDRAELARSPAIAPRLLSTAQPQTFYVRSDAHSLHVALDDGIELEGQSLGEGLFRVAYDPRRDGVPKLLDGALPIAIHADNGSSQRTLQLVTPLRHPRWFCRSPSGQRAATLSEETDELFVLDALTTKPEGVSVGDGPLDCAFLSEQVVAISHRHAPELWIADLAATPVSFRVLALDAPPGRMAWDAEHAELLVARGGAAPGLWHIAWPELSVKTVSPLPVAADWLALCDEALIVSARADASLRRLEREGEHFVPRQLLLLGRPAAALAVDASTDRVFASVTDFRPPPASPQLGNHFVQDMLLVLDARELSVTQSVLTARRSERQTKPGDMDRGGSPLGLWPLRDGRLAVALAGTDELWRLSLPQAEPNSLPLDGENLYTPHGVVELQDGTLWLSAPAAGMLAKLPKGASALQLFPLAASDRTLASARPDALARRIGERGFYESTRSGISCQSCHMHADSDVAAYNLGDHKLIPTLSVRGLFGTAPYLRDGSYPRISDLDDVAQTLYRGYVRQQPGRRYALQAYVQSLPRAAPLVLAPDSAVERRGYAVFQRAGCERCHTPPAFTNLGQLPLAALFPRTAAAQEKKEQLDVPSLLSVSLSPPYLHDGRAASLRAVLTEENPDNLHGNTRGMSEADLGDLLRFLESL